MTKQSGAEEICRGDRFAVTRSGRFLAAELLSPHRVLSTSAYGGGQSDAIRYIVNHQSCEASGHTARHEVITDLGQAGYHQEVCRELGLPGDEVALMGTAANMNYAAHISQEHAGVEVTAIVTAGVQGNATRAGDTARWAEDDDGWSKLPYDGTINTMVLINCPLTSGALARAVVTMTEGKSAALAELAIASRQSGQLATGTGTDQFAIAAPLDPRRKPKESASTHSKLGELIGRTVLEATKEALRWQNGLEPSYTRGVEHALGRFGLTREHILERVASLLSEEEMALLRKNEKALFFEPRVGAGAYAFAAVLDRARYGTIPPGQADEVLRQQAAFIACSAGAKPERWHDYWMQLDHGGDPVDLVIRALALGWKTKWT